MVQTSGGPAAAHLITQCRTVRAFDGDFRARCGSGRGESNSHDRTPRSNATDPAIAAVRYQIKDVDRAIEFSTALLDFKLERKAGTAFAMISRGPLQLVLSGPGSSGARPMPDGRRQEPGGWNRIIIYVSSTFRVSTRRFRG